LTRSCAIRRSSRAAKFADSEIVASKPEAFKAFLAAERVRWVRLVRETGIKVQ